MWKFGFSMLFLVLCTQLFASSVELFLKLGVTNTDERISMSVENKNTSVLTGFDIGAIVAVNPIEKLGIQFEPGIITKGSDHDGLFTYDDNSYRLYYLSLPVLINYKVYKQLHIIAGPEFNQLIDVIGHAGADKFNASRYYSEKTEIGIQGGFSYVVLGKWYFGVKYTYGLTPTNKLTTRDALGNVSDNTTDFYNQGVIVHVGWKLFQ